MEQTYRILRLEINNFQGVRDLEIEPSGPVVELAGETGAGKSSVLRLLEHALGDRRQYNYSLEMLRHGEYFGYGKIWIGTDEDSVDNPAHILTLEVARDPKTREEKPPKLLLESRGVGAVKTVATEVQGFGTWEILKHLDEFLRLKPAEQAKRFLDMLDLKFHLRRGIEQETDLPEEHQETLEKSDEPSDSITLADVEEEIDRLMEDRKRVNREIKNLRAAITEMPEPPDDTPDQILTTREAIASMERAREAHRQHEAKLERISSLGDFIDSGYEARIAELGRDAAKHEDEYESAVERIDEWEAEEIERIKAEAQRRKDEAHRRKATLDDTVSMSLASLEAQFEDFVEEERILTAEIENANLPDLEAMQRQIDDMETVNDYVRQKAEIRERETRLANMDSEAEEYTQRIEMLREEIKAAMDRAETPVEGLEVRSDGVYINDTPLRSCSGMERLQAALAIPLRQGARLPLFVIDEGDQLAGKTYAMIEAKLSEVGAQLWVTTRREISAGAIRLSDGKREE